jgi:hypothetical protein
VEKRVDAPQGFLSVRSVGNGLFVIPAEAGIQPFKETWTPALRE